MSKALALLEYGSVAVGVLAVDRMLKKSPVALLRCGTVHPGRYLSLVGGSVAATEEAHAEGKLTGEDSATLLDEVCLPDPHPALEPALIGDPAVPGGETVGVLEVSTSAALLRILDVVLKAVPIGLSELRLGDALGGKAVAIVSGDLADVQEAVAQANGCAGAGEVLGASVLSNVDPLLREVLGEGTRFAKCRNWSLDSGETVED